MRRLDLLVAASALLLFLAATPTQSPPGTIAFVSDRDGDLEIFRVQADGSGLWQLTRNTVEDRDPVWSPDGRRLAFISRRDNNVDIYLVNADGSGERRVTTAPDGDHTPSWAPDSRRLAFVSSRDGPPAVFLVNADGTGEVRLTDSGVDAYQEAWSPDGRAIAFLSSRAGIDSEGTGEIFVTDLQSRTTTRLIPEKRRVLAFSWSPDGRQIAFFSTGNRKLEISIVNADGSGERNLSAAAGAATDTHPCWSPDGSRIAFLTARGGGGSPLLYVMNADGTGASRVSPAGEPASMPLTWSPTGSHLAYGGFGGGHPEVLVIPVTGGAPRPLATHPGMDLGPQWLPQHRGGRRER